MKLSSNLLFFLNWMVLQQRNKKKSLLQSPPFSICFLLAGWMDSWLAGWLNFKRSLPSYVGVFNLFIQKGQSQSPLFPFIAIMFVCIKLYLQNIVTGCVCIVQKYSLDERETNRLDFYCYGAVYCNFVKKKNTQTYRLSSDDEWEWVMIMRDPILIFRNI